MRRKLISSFSIKDKMKLKHELGFVCLVDCLTKACNDCMFLSCHVLVLE